MEIFKFHHSPAPPCYHWREKQPSGKREWKKSLCAKPWEQGRRPKKTSLSHTRWWSWCLNPWEWQNEFIFKKWQTLFVSSEHIFLASSSADFISFPCHFQQRSCCVSSSSSAGDEMKKRERARRAKWVSEGSRGEGQNHCCVMRWQWQRWKLSKKIGSIVSLSLSCRSADWEYENSLAWWLISYKTGRIVTHIIRNRKERSFFLRCGGRRTLWRGKWRWKFDWLSHLLYLLPTF